MNDERDEYGKRRPDKFDETVERLGREVGRKAEEWGAHVERKADEWSRRMEDKAERWSRKIERKAERRAWKDERRAERDERRAERREEWHMRRQGRYHEGRRTTLYRSRSGKISGVCKGIADYYDFNVRFVRLLFVVLAFTTGFWPAVITYVVAAMVMKPEPVLPLETEEDEEFYQSYSGSRTMALHRLKRTYDNLNRRIQRLENTVTARDFDWDERLNR